MTNIRFKQVLVPKENPFENDRLNRAKLAPILEDLVLSSQEVGGTIALNGRWGSGKTAFVSMWKQWMENQKYNVLYFDAWSSDFIEDPIYGLFGELKELKPKDESLYNKIYNNLGNICKVLSVTSAKVLLRKIVGSDVFDESVKDISSINFEDSVWKDTVEEYSGLTRKMEAFKNSLVEYSKSLSEDKPLVFIVDELDRCRPDYAIKVLERIKHLFSVPNVVFLLAIDREQLSHAVRGFYGSDRINAEEYLKRFIDVTFNLPDTLPETLTDFAYNELEINKLVEHIHYRSFGVQVDDPKEFACLLTYLIHYKKLNIRQVEKLVSYFSITLRALYKRDKQNGVCSVKSAGITLLLCYLLLDHKDIYDNIEKGDITLQELVNSYEKVFPAKEVDIELSVSSTYYNPGIMYDIYAQLLYSYKNEYCKYSTNILIDEGKHELSFETNYHKETLYSMLVNHRFIYLKTFIDRIQLLEFIN